MWTKNFQIYKLDLEKAEEPEIKLPASTGSWKKERNSKKYLLLFHWLWKWITTNWKILTEWGYQTTLPASWETCMHVKKQQLEPDMEQCLLLLLLPSRFSCVRLCAAPEMAHQAPPSLGFSRQEYWSGLPFPSPMHQSEKWKSSRSVMSDSLRPHGLQLTRLLHPRDFPGKSTGVGCHCLLPGTMDWFQIEKEVSQGYILSPYLCNFYAECIMQNARLDEAQAGIKIARRNINNLRYADDTTLTAEN